MEIDQDSKHVVTWENSSQQNELLAPNLVVAIKKKAKAMYLGEDIEHTTFDIHSFSATLSRSGSLGGAGASPSIIR